MANISYMRAGASCLPLVGPFVGLYNTLEVKSELSFSPLSDSLSKMRYSLIGMKASLSAFAGNPEGVEEAEQELEREQTELKNKYLPASQKGRLYAICGIVGNVLSVATVVGLIALGILTVAHGVMAATLFTSQAAVLSYNLYQHNNNIKAFQPAG